MDQFGSEYDVPFDTNGCECGGLLVVFVGGQLNQTDLFEVVVFFASNRMYLCIFVAGELSFGDEDG